MPLTDIQMKEILQQRIKTEEVIVEDQSGGCGAKFSAIIISKDFEGKSLLERHRMVNDAIKDEMKDIHAFSMKTWTPEQWEKKKNE